MKRINIKNLTDTARERLQEELDSIQQGCRVRTITADDVEYYVHKAVEEYILMGASRASMDGLTFRLDPNCQDFAKSYKGRPESTIIAVEITKTGYYVVNLFRGDTFRGAHNLHADRIPDAMVKAITERLYAMEV